MTTELTIPVMPASAMGASFYDARQWYESLGSCPISTYIYDKSAPAAHKPITELTQYSRNSAPEIFARFFSNEVFQSDSMTLTLIKSGILVGGRAVVCYGDVSEFCAAESLGLQIHDPFQLEHRTFKAERAKDGGNMKINWLEPPERDQTTSQYLNVLMPLHNNYGHWHVHILAFLGALSKVANNLVGSLGIRGVRLFSVSQNDGFLRDLKAYSVETFSPECHVEVMPLDKISGAVFASNILVSSSFILPRGATWPTCYNPLFRQHRVSRDINAPSRIYINRSHAGRRGIQNEPALENALSDLGFAIVAPGKMSYSEQRQAFSNVKCIIGSHGAALTNMVYSHCEPAVIELTHDRYGAVQYGWFRNLAATMGLRYGAHINKLTEEQRKQDYYNTEFDADIESVVRVVKSLLP